MPRPILMALTSSDVLAPVSRELAASLKGERQLSDRCVFHCSGAMDLSSLEALASLGIHTGSIHPLQSFAEPSAERLKGI